MRKYSTRWFIVGYALGTICAHLVMDAPWWAVQAVAIAWGIFCGKTTTKGE